MQPDVHGFFDKSTSTITYVVRDAGSNACAIVDPVLDYDPASGRTSTGSAEAIAAFVESAGLRAEWILETHVHADHLTAAPFLKKRLGGRTGIGSKVVIVQDVFAKIFNAESAFRRDGGQFDVLFDDGAEISIGGLIGRAIYTPGHTPACMTYVFGDAAFVGDTLFMPDYGTARCDFPGGDARQLYRSIQKIFALPPGTRLFLCHDYLPAGRTSYCWETTVSAERANNIHIRDGVSEEQFVEIRKTRDAVLHMPALIIPSVQVNMRAGGLPPAEENGVSYLKIPVDLL
ncbi:MBL fold metallo-hydrolase [Methylocapsa acidiphila]|uniref:MBL fold metallo-hydrolase n=1 Tax=Methylocapsa acidiphila TaxID=133552 RepID=UPI00041CAC8C|nr:MBL fold metallo-hydrolase [Methylocapsa acidiphila]